MYVPRIPVAAALALMLAACAAHDARHATDAAPAPARSSAAARADASVRTPVSPRDAIWRAAESPELGAPGPFEMTVKAVGRQGRHVYLNSELDYRDSRCLVIAITPPAAASLERDLAKFEHALIGKRILVEGVAWRTRIDFIGNGRPTGKYYYQTQVPVTDPAQIRVLD